MNENNKDNRFSNNNERLNYLNESQAKLTKQQEESLVIDFDKAIMENKKTILVKFLNKNYHLPAEMPFNFSTFFLRKCLKKNANGMFVDIPDDEVLNFIKLMFGEDFFKALEESKNANISINMVMGTLAPPVLKAWGYDTTQEDTTNQKKRQAMMKG